MLEKRKKLDEYLTSKRLKLEVIKSEIRKNSQIFGLFEGKNWFNKVEKQINIWKENPELYFKNRTITVKEYELFRYFSENSILQNFLDSFILIEGCLKDTNANQLSQWNSTKSLFFSEDASQIYSSLFEMLMLGKLISTGKKTDIYYENIDGRIWMDKRYIYFEIKSLQRSSHDLEGIGARSTEYDKNQIYRALKNKNRQLFRYRNFPTLIFLSLYRLTDMTTAGWYIPDYFSEPENQLGVNNKVISGVKVYSWFTVRGESAFYPNPNTINEFSQIELEFFSNLLL